MNPTPDDSTPSHTSESSTASQPTSNDAGTSSHPSPWPLRLAIIVAVVSTLCIGGAFVAYRTYDNATKPNRSAPDVVVDNYLRAFLDHHDDGEAAQYACADQSGLAPIKAFREAAAAKQKQPGTTISFSWGPLTRVAGDASGVRMTTEITEHAEIDGILQSLTSSWSFATVKDGDWRVCEASRRAVASPSQSLSP